MQLSGPNLNSARDLAQKHPGAKVIATKANHMPSAAEIASFRAEGGEFLAERFAESLPPGSVDKIYVRYPIPHAKGAEVVAAQGEFARLVEVEMRQTPGIARGEAMIRAGQKVVPPQESITNFGPHAIEKLAPGGSIEVVFWEKSIAGELADLTEHRYMDPVTGQHFRLNLEGPIRSVDRRTVAPASGYGIPDFVTTVSVATMKKVTTP
jgi:hypothetical protein